MTWEEETKGILSPSSRNGQIGWYHVVSVEEGNPDRENMGDLLTQSDRKSKELGLELAP